METHFQESSERGKLEDTEKKTFFFESRFQEKKFSGPIGREKVGWQEISNFTSEFLSKAFILSASPSPHTYG
jgi:hypothetical protein